MINVLLIDEKNVSSEGLQLIINSETDMNVVGIVNKKSIEKLEYLKPDVILFKSNFIDSKITDHIHRYKLKHPKVKLIYIFADMSNLLFYDAAKMKPNGFINEGFPPNKFVGIIREVYRNEYVISGGLAQLLFNSMQHIDDLKKIVLKRKLEERSIEVTMRDLDILYLLYLEKSNKEITDDLGLEEKSVRYYVSKAYKKLQLKSRIEVKVLLKELIEQ